MAVTTEAFAHALIEERPLTTAGGAYVAQTAEYLSAVAPRIWEQLRPLLGPFPGKCFRLHWSKSPLLLCAADTVLPATHDRHVGLT